MSPLEGQKYETKTISLNLFLWRKDIVPPAQAKKILSCSIILPAVIHGGWTTWNDVSPCSRDCGIDRFKLQGRNCSNPIPANGGNNCTGVSTRNTTCPDLMPCKGNILHACHIKSYYEPIACSRWSTIALFYFGVTTDAPSGIPVHLVSLSMNYTCTTPSNQPTTTYEGYNGMILYGNEVYSFGGKVLGSGDGGYQAWKYNLTNRIWIPLQDMPIPRYPSSVIQIQEDEFWILGNVQRYLQCVCPSYLSNSARLMSIFSFISLILIGSHIGNSTRISNQGFPR